MEPPQKPIGNGGLGETYSLYNIKPLPNSWWFFMCSCDFHVRNILKEVDIPWRGVTALRKLFLIDFLYAFSGHFSVELFLSFSVMKLSQTIYFLKVVIKLQQLFWAAEVISAISETTMFPHQTLFPDPIVWIWLEFGMPTARTYGYHIKLSLIFYNFLKVGLTRIQAVTLPLGTRQTLISVVKDVSIKVF